MNELRREVNPLRLRFFLLRSQLQRSIISIQHGAQRFNHQFMIGPLRQSGNRHAANDARAFDRQRKITLWSTLCLTVQSILLSLLLN